MSATLIFDTTGSTPSATTGNPFSNGMSLPVEDHAFEIEITDANTSITAIAIDFYFTVQDLSEIDNPTASANLYLKKTHTFTAGQLTDLKHMVVINDQPGCWVAAGINSITGADANDVVKIYYAARNVT
jgi:hypothetical protein